MMPPPAVRRLVQVHKILQQRLFERNLPTITMFFFSLAVVAMSMFDSQICAFLRFYRC